MSEISISTGLMDTDMQLRWPWSKEPDDRYSVLRDAYAAGEAAKKILAEQQALIREALEGGVDGSTNGNS